jgi:hypothetical protein
MPLSDAQLSVAARIKGLVTSMLRPPFSFGGRGRMKAAALLHFVNTSSQLEPGQRCKPPPELDVQEFRAARAKFMKSDCKFDPTPFLSMFSAACYLEPRLLAVAYHGPVIPSMKQSGEEGELVAYAKSWDKQGKLWLCGEDEVPSGKRSKFIPVWKDEHTDRIVHDRRRMNAMEAHLGGSSRDLASAADFIEMEVPPGWEARLWTDDLIDMYPSFVASKERAQTNAVARVFPSSCFEGTKALKSRPDLVGKPVLACLQSLVMGDKNAVDWAEDSHIAVLESAGSYPASVRVRNNHPFPRGQHFETVVVDDHIGVGIVPQRRTTEHAALASSFAKAVAFYPSVGLLHHPDKYRRGARTGVALGAESLGPQRIWGAERQRRFALSLISLNMVRHQKTAGAALRKLVSSWVHCLLFRRVLMSLLHACYRHQPPLPLDSVIFKLPQSACAELQLLAVLSPMMTANLGAVQSQELIATDASPFALGATRAKVPTSVHRELWRRRKRKGHYTCIASRAAEYLRAVGLEKEAACMDEQILSAQAGPRRSLIEVFDFVELCCGGQAPLITAMGQAGLRCGPRIDIKHNLMWDITSSRMFEWIVFMLAHDRIYYLHVGPPCTTFSIARCPKLRSKALPGGFDRSDAATHLGNLLLMRCLALLSYIHWHTHRHGSHEHPASAFSWQWNLVTTLFGKDGCSIVPFAMCSYGAPYKKMTKLGIVRASFLTSLEKPCTGFHSHIRLEGSLTTQASEYPAGLCQAWAALLVDAIAHDACPLDPVVSEQVEVGLEQVWVNQLMGGLSWDVMMSQKCLQGEHINILEVRATVKTMQIRACEVASCRQLYVLDSQVGIGALAKGRSASPSINNELRLAIPWCIGHDHYPGYDYGPSRLNPSDDPSRLKPLRSPLHPLPAWYHAACAGSLQDLDAWALLPTQKRATASWARFVLTLAGNLYFG